MTVLALWWKRLDWLIGKLVRTGTKAMEQRRLPCLETGTDEVVLVSVQSSGVAGSGVAR